jgi:protein TonB
MAFLGVRWSLPTATTETIQVEMIDAPPIPQPPQEIQTSLKPKEQKQVQPMSAKPVTGIRRDALTDVGAKVENVKKGNTLSKKADEKILKDSDPTTLPVPEKEFLITQMPAVLAEAKIRYPEDAKELGLEGVVTMSVLIDKTGEVRDAKIVEGLLPSMDKEALRAIFFYKFSPALKEGRAVASQIRFAVRFVLENN